MPKRVAIDLFCGAGGTSSGAEATGDCTVKLAVNHWDTAVSTHSANFPHCLHVNSRVEDVPLSAVPKRTHILFASPECTGHSRARGGRPTSDQARCDPWSIMRYLDKRRPDWLVIENVIEFCFPAQTAVLTKRGVIQIGEIAVGDEVWTHNARWKPVTAVMRRVSPTVRVLGYGNSIIEATPNHPFYARQYAPKITKSGKYGRHEARLLEPEWVRADRLADHDATSAYTLQYSGYAWASPCELPRYWMRMPGRLGVDTSAPAFFYMLGRWLGDGWIRRRKNEQSLVRICANIWEADELQQRLAETGLSWHRQNHSETVDVFDLSAESSRILVRWITKNFGEYADRKTLPAWIYGASELQRESLIEGYCDADGHEQPDGNKLATTSVSRCLAVGIRLLLQSLGIAASLSKVEASVQPYVGDPSRTMNCRESYSVSWRRENDWEKCHRTDLHIWGPVREVHPAGDAVEVVDITVADDHSFIADGQVVHNCEWGPVGDNGRPLKSRKGTIFTQWLQAIEAFGYHAEYRTLNAADFGAATSRERFFLIARKGRRSPVFPEPIRTQAPGGELPGMSLPRWRAAAEVIDWRIPCPSIFGRKRPLADKTLLRIEAGLRRFVGPFIAGCGGRAGQSPAIGLGQPVGTMTAKADRCLVLPYGVVLRNNQDAADLNDPVATMTAGGRHSGVAVPFVSAFHNGSDGPNRNYSPADTLPTQDTSNRYGVAVPFVATVNHGGNDGRVASVGDTLSTVTSKRGEGIAVPLVMSNLSMGVARPAGANPTPTLTASGGTHLIVPWLSSYYGNETFGGPDSPVATITTKDRHSLITATCDPWYGQPDSLDLCRWEGEGGACLPDPSPALLKLLDTMRRLGVVDIGFRMLSNRELSAAQGFREDYLFMGTKADVTRQIGNSVSPPVAQAITQTILGA